MDRPKYGMLTDPARDIVKEIGAAHRMGFDYVELGIEIPEGHYDILKRRRREILKALKKFKHPPIAHTPYWTDFWSDHEEVRRAWLMVAMKSIDAATPLGCNKFNIHAPILKGMYNHSVSHGERALKNMVRSLRELVRHASGRDMTIVLENMGPFGISFKTYCSLVNRVPGLKVHVDIGHAFIEGGMPMVSRYIRAFKDRLEHTHFNDNLGLQDDHIGIGQGVIDYFRVMRLLRRIRYDKTITLEIFSGRRDLKNSLKIIRAIEEDVW